MPRSRKRVPRASAPPASASSFENDVVAEATMDVMDPAPFCGEGDASACLWLQREYAKLMRHEAMLRASYPSGPLQGGAFYAGAYVPVAPRPDLQVEVSAPPTGSPLPPAIVRQNGIVGNTAAASNSAATRPRWGDDDA